MTLQLQRSVLDLERRIGRLETLPVGSVMGGGSGAATRVAVWSDANTLTGYAAMTFDSATGLLAVTGPVRGYFTGATEASTYKYAGYFRINGAVASDSTNSWTGVYARLADVTVATGKTDSGYTAGVYVENYRSDLAADIGTLAQQYGVRVGVGHYTSAENPARTTNNSYGVHVTLVRGGAASTIGNLYGIYIAESGTAATVSGTYRGVYVTTAGLESYFGGSIRMGAYSGYGLRFWNNDGTSYSLYMSIYSDATWGSQIAATNEYNMYFRMGAGANRGFVWQNYTSSVLTTAAHLTGGGDFYLNGSIKQSTAIWARAYNNANLSINNSTWTLVTLNSEWYDTDSMHSTISNTSRMTATRAGTYLLNFHGKFAANGTGVRAAMIRRDAAGNSASGTLIAYVSAATAGSTLDHGFTITSIDQASASSYYEVFVWQTSGGALNLLTSTADSPEFQMIRIA